MKTTSARFARGLLARVQAMCGTRAAPPRAARPPRPIFPPRRDLVVSEEDDVRIVVAGRPRLLAFPIDWQTATEDHATTELHTMQWIEALDDFRFKAVILDWIADTRARGYDPAEDPTTTSQRCVTWMQQLAARAHRLPAEFIDTVDASIADRVRHVSLALHFRGTAAESLHGARLLCWAGGWFEGVEADGWRRRGARLLARVLAHDFTSDGVLAGSNPASHARVCAWLLECRAVLGGHELQPLIDTAIERACGALCDLVHPDGYPSLLCGGHLHSGQSPAAILEAAQRLCGVRTVRRPRIALEQPGLCGWREGRTYFLFACGGEQTSTRAGADSLAFEWTLHGERLFVAGGQLNAALESRGPGADHGLAEDTCVLRTRHQILPDGMVAEGTSDGGARKNGRPLHRRLLRSTCDSLRIEDRATGGNGQDVRAQLVCHPNARARYSADGTVTVRRGAVAVRIESTHPITIEDAVWQPDAGLEIRTRRIVVHYGMAPCTGSIRMQSLVARPPEMLELAAAPALR